MMWQYALAGYFVYALLTAQERETLAIERASHDLDMYAREFVHAPKPKILKALAAEFGDPRTKAPPLEHAGAHHATFRYSNATHHKMPGGGIMIQSGIPIQHIAELGTDYGRPIYA